MLLSVSVYQSSTRWQWQVFYFTKIRIRWLTAELLVAVGYGGPVDVGVQQQLSEFVDWNRKTKIQVSSFSPPPTLISVWRKLVCTFSDGPCEERLRLRSVRSVGPEQVPAGRGATGGHLHTSFFCSSSSCRLHQVRKQSDTLLQELQHLPVLLLDVSWVEMEEMKGRYRGEEEAREEI